MNRFFSSKNTLTIAILWGLVLILLAILYITIQSGERNVLSILVVILTICLVIWILFDTRYVINSHFLLYRQGPFRGRINIMNIKSIENFSGMIPPVTMKPALGNDGFIINYDQYDSVFMTPQEKSIFIAELIKINSNIDISKVN